ncbi:unnamed protein product [Adineta ricciae]|uniref:G-protein coupled receptors family 1 profile domain-containing protein n=1 Tax=Adineta ricciae TaxID=249248 RepID=A0A814FU33_ADIRI|nr:unnamed protein product [Adineta ricciae]CAF1363145.1 unnamed protein product [Adineta ricciae]
MSQLNISSLNIIAQQVAIYAGIPILSIGVLGNLINVIVFLSLQTFRQSSCAVYLIVMSIINNGQLVTGLLTRIMISGFGIDWTETSLFYCKFRQFCIQTCVSISMTCMCLATIDQFLATCYSRQWQQWSNIQVAHRLTFLSVIIWLVHGIPYWFYYSQVQSICMITNRIFQIYAIAIHIVSWNSLIPTIICILFGLLAYRNIQDISYRTIPLVRRELDKQLTSIVLVQIIVNFVTTVPYVTVNIFILYENLAGSDTISSDKVRFANMITIYLFYMTFASPFYIYMCVSGRFRQQFVHVFFQVRVNKWRRRIANTVYPNA